MIFQFAYMRLNNKYVVRGGCGMEEGKGGAGGTDAFLVIRVLSANPLKCFDYRLINELSPMTQR